MNTCNSDIKIIELYPIKHDPKNHGYHSILWTDNDSTRIRSPYTTDSGGIFAGDAWSEKACGKNPKSIVGRFGDYDTPIHNLKFAPMIDFPKNIDISKIKSIEIEMNEYGPITYRKFGISIIDVKNINF